MLMIKVSKWPSTDNFWAGGNLHHLEDYDYFTWTQTNQENVNLKFFFFDCQNPD